jgi:hypothetical protein
MAAVVEKWIPQANVHRDLFGFADVLAVHPGRREFLLVQATTVDHVAHRLAKARGRQELAAWLRAGGKFFVWGWCQKGGHWQVKQVEVRGEDLAAVTVAAPPRSPRRRTPTPGLFDGM